MVESVVLILSISTTAGVLGGRTREWSKGMESAFTASLAHLECLDLTQIQWC